MLGALFLLGSGIAAGFAASRALLDRPEAPQGLPEPVQERADALYGRLQRLRSRAVDAIAAGREERDTAERELHDDFLRRTHRTDASIASDGASRR